MQISLGLFGVITEVTIQCESAFKLQETTEKSTMDACLLNLDQLAYSAEHVKIWLEPYSNFCDIYKFNRTSEKIHMTNVIWWIGMKVRSIGRRGEGGKNWWGRIWESKRD